MFNPRFRPVTFLALAILVAAPVAAEEVWFAGVASLPGTNNTNWRSEVVLHNASTTPQEVQLDLRARALGTVAAGVTLTLAPGEVRAIPDLYSEIGATPGSGLLRIDGPVMAWVRTFNHETTGTFGQHVPAMRLRDSVPPGDKRRFQAVASRNVATGFRSNLLLLNLASEPVTFTIRGCNTSTSIEIAGNAYDQLNNIGSWLGCAAGPFVAEVDATGPWNGYVSSIDPVTGDPTTVPGIPVWTAGEPGNRAPIISMFVASPAEILANKEFDLHGAFYDPDQEPVTWSLRILSSSTAEGQFTGPTSGTGVLVSRVRVFNAGLIVVEVTVRDTKGGVTKALTAVTVRWGTT